MGLEIVDDGLLELLDESVEVELLATGFDFIEGPIWVVGDDYLLFSDIPSNTRIRWDERGGARVVAEPTNKANGMTLDAEGRLVVCEHTSSALVRMDASGTGAGRKVLASHFEGKELNSPNDVVVHPDGSIYFTDPLGGRANGRMGLERDPELDFQGVFRLSPDGTLTAIARDFELPNGLCFAPDLSILYVNDTPRAHIRSLAVTGDGTVTGDEVFAEDIGDADPEIGLVDGMKCDQEGNVWVTGPYGVWVLDPDGNHLGTVPVPGRAGNLHWGGPEWSWLFITASSGLYRVVTKVSGAHEPFMDIR